MSEAVTVRLLTQISSVGGSMQTGVKALTVRPQGRPSCRVVMTVTPPMTRRIAALKESASGPPLTSHAIG